MYYDPSWISNCNQLIQVHQPYTYTWESHHLLSWLSTLKLTLKAKTLASSPSTPLLWRLALDLAKVQVWPTWNIWTELVGSAAHELKQSPTPMNLRYPATSVNTSWCQCWSILWLSRYSVSQLLEMKTNLMRLGHPSSSIRCSTSLSSHVLDPDHCKSIRMLWRAVEIGVWVCKGFVCMFTKYMHVRTGVASAKMSWLKIQEVLLRFGAIVSFHVDN